MACILGIEQPCDECGLCGNSPTWRYKMAKCKYPNEVCANMTVYHGVAYCDSVPCSLKDELPKQANADRIRNMTNKELAEFLLIFDGERNKYNYIIASDSEFALYNSCNSKEEAMRKQLEWLESECDVE